MSDVQFRDAFEILCQFNPDRPIGLLIPEAIGQITLGAAGQAGSIQILPGERLGYKLTRTKIELWMNTEQLIDNGPHFSANLHLNDHPESVNFSVRNTTGLYTKETHPHIYPGRLLTASVAHFEEQLEKPLPVLSGIWESETDSVNYAAYRAARRAGASKTDAAFDTWTGRQARKLGFTKVRVDDHPATDDTVYANFSRPQEKRRRIFTRG